MRDRGDPWGKPRGVMTGGRLVELVLVTLISAGISGAIVAYGTLQVLKTEIRYMRIDINETRSDVQELRRDLYAPRAGPAPEDVLISDLKTRLNASLQDAASVFDDADFDRHIRVALRAMALEKRPRRVSTVLDLSANEGEYDAPADLVAFDRLVWTNEHARQPWERGYTGPAPTATVLRQSSGNLIVLQPPPDRRQVEALGGSVRMFYRADHETSGAGASEEVTTLAESDIDLVILRAQVEAMRELAFRNVTKPVELRGGGLSQPRNGTPGALFSDLLAEWRAAP